MANKKKAKVWFQFGDQKDPRNKVEDPRAGLQIVHRSEWWLALGDNMPLTRSSRARHGR